MNSSALLHWSSALFVSQAVCQKLIFDKKRRTKRPGKSHRAPVSCFSLLIYFFEPHVARLVFHPRVARASTDTLRSIENAKQRPPDCRARSNVEKGNTHYQGLPEDVGPDSGKSWSQCSRKNEKRQDKKCQNSEMFQISRTSR